MSSGAAATNPLTVLRNPPLASLIFFAIIGLAGVVWTVLRTGREIVATCGGDAMAPGDICTTRGRRSVTATEWTYDERLEFATAQNNGSTAAGIALAACAALVIIFLLIRWIRDRAVAATLDGQEPPVTSYADRSGSATGFISLLACAAAFFGVSMLVQGLTFTVRNQIGSIAIGAVLVVAALVVLVLAFPRGSTLVWAKDDSVRVVTRSRIQDLAWQDMQYLVSFSAQPLKELSWTGKAPKLTIDDQDFFAVMRDRINATLQQTLPARDAAGETLDFGAVTVAGSRVTVDKTVLDRAQIAAIGKGRKDNVDCLAFADHAGNTVATVTEMKVANRDLLPGLLTGHRPA